MDGALTLRSVHTAGDGTRKMVFDLQVSPLLHSAHALDLLAPIPAAAMVDVRAVERVH